jgi:DNA-binding NtrC family response regulator
METLGKVLVVDDEGMARTQLATILSQRGHQVASVASGPEALKYLSEDNDPYVVLLDLNMPDMNGIQVLMQLAEGHVPNHHPYMHTLQVIVVTARGSVESYIESMNLGAYEYLNKPVKVPDLLKHIDKAFENVQEAKLQCGRARPRNQAGENSAPEGGAATG